MDDYYIVCTRSNSTISLSDVESRFSYFKDFYYYYITACTVVQAVV